MRNVTVATIVLALGAGCGGTTSEPAGAAGSAGAGGSGGAPGLLDASAEADASGQPGGESYSLTIGPIDVPAGGEDTQCIVARLGNLHSIHVGRLRDDLGTASHHLIVYRTNDTVEKTTPFACTPFVDTLNPAKGAPLAVSQKKSDVVQLPDGVGITLDATQMIRLELHYVNATAAPVQAQATATFDTISDAAYHDEGDFLFIGNPDIRVPAHASFTLGPTYFPLPAEYADAKFFAVTGHTHRYGTSVTIATTPSATGADTPVYDVPGWSWSEPATVQHDPPFQVPPSGGFRFTCNWTNTGDAAVKFGESATDEMCFFWAYYYPSHGAKVCIHTDQYSLGGNAGISACCPGDALCSLITQYL